MAVISTISQNVEIHVELGNMNFGLANWGYSDHLRDSLSSLKDLYASSRGFSSVRTYVRIPGMPRTYQHRPYDTPRIVSEPKTLYLVDKTGRECRGRRGARQSGKLPKLLDGKPITALVVGRPCEMRSTLPSKNRVEGAASHMTRFTFCVCCITYRVEYSTYVRMWFDGYSRRGSVR
jgi:hypothetical protein